MGISPKPNIGHVFGTEIVPSYNKRITIEYDSVKPSI